LSDLDYRGAAVLITGGLGFIGSNIARALVGRGARVTIVDALIPGLGGNRFNVAGVEDRLEIAIEDIRDLATIESLAARAEVVFNLAAQVDHIASMDDPIRDLDISGKGALTVLEACRRAGRRIRIVFPGSRLQFGRPRSIPVDENHPMDPMNIYAVHRLLGECYHMVYGREMGLSTCVLRLSNPFGPRQQMRHSKYGILNWFIRLAIEGKEITLYGDGSQQRDYFFVEDAVDAFLRAGSMEAADGQIFNVGAGTPITVADAAETIVKVVKSGSVARVPWPADRSRQETGGYVTDTSKVRRILGWSPKVPFEEGVRRTAEYYRANREHYW
jgi:UDP-glucose 4-epimerase